MTQPKMKRITVYVSEDEYIRLRKELIDRGTSVSEWFRIQMRKFLKTYKF